MSETAAFPIEPQSWDEVPPYCAEVLRLEATRQAQVAKVDAPAQVVAGWASVCLEADGTPVVDSHDDIIPDLANMVARVREFMLQDHRPLVLQHQIQRDADGTPITKDDGEPAFVEIGTVLESIVVTDAVKAALELPPATPLGWIAAGHVSDAPTWDRVEKGELRMFSWGGLGIREQAPATETKGRPVRTLFEVFTTHRHAFRGIVAGGRPTLFDALRLK